ncbi:hypothetical protein CMO91_00345 [Candidatus Woesearchaeota archaeon]|nr:hypothetical protein [Candidatus Woesearchaeota archaeon]|tara:strand:- start:529 stop:1095 length:567 start_codon:yes stop_codon:yes gene_type:complete
MTDTSHRAELLVPNQKVKLYDTTYTWHLFSDRIQIQRREVKEVGGRKKRITQIFGLLYFCKQGVRDVYDPPEDHKAPITADQISSTKDELYKPLMARRFAPSGWAEDTYLHVAHDRFVTCVSLEIMLATGQGYRPKFVYDHGTRVLNIGFADPDEMMTPPEQDTISTLPLCVRSLSKITFIDSGGNPA